jgi:hypothetical protein
VSPCVGQGVGSQPERVQPGRGLTWRRGELAGSPAPTHLGPGLCLHLGPSQHCPGAHGGLYPREAPREPSPSPLHFLRPVAAAPQSTFLLFFFLAALRMEPRAFHSEHSALSHPHPGVASQGSSLVQSGSETEVGPTSGSHSCWSSSGAWGGGSAIHLAFSPPCSPRFNHSSTRNGRAHLWGGSLHVTYGETEAPRTQVACWSRRFRPSLRREGEARGGLRGLFGLGSQDQGSSSPEAGASLRRGPGGLGRWVACV